MTRAAPRATPSAYHRACLRLHGAHPEGLLALSTHDTKRSEDVRARIAVLAEIPDEWNAAVLRWEKLAARHRPAGGSVARQDHRVVDVPDAGGGVADRHRPAGSVPEKADPGGQSPHVVDRPEP